MTGRQDCGGPAPDRSGRDRRAEHELGRLWDEGLASGRADEDETIEDIKKAARAKDGA